MVSRRDQFQAYQFMNRRYAAALLRGESDSVEGPLRRLGASVAASVTVAVLAVAAVGMYGLLRPGGAAGWQDGKSLILERETGTRYVYLNGVLHPVLNYASAELILRSAATPVPVGRDSLAGTPHGDPVGIPGAPDSSPTSSTLLEAPWTVCSEPATDAAGGSVPPLVRVSVGKAASGDAVRTGGGVLVKSSDGTQYVVWNGQRLRLASASVLAALNNTQAMTVGDGWLNALPQGPDLGPPAIPGIGNPAPAIGTTPTRVGQVFQVNGGVAFYVMYPDGLAPVTSLQAQLLLDSPALVAAYSPGAPRPLPLSAGEVGTARMSAVNPSKAIGLPAQFPILVDSSTTMALCASYTYTDAAGTAIVSAVTTRTMAPQTRLAAVPVDVLGGPVADSFDIAAGHGAVVRALASPGVSAQTTYLITDLGIKFPLAANNVQDDLGLKGAKPVLLPVGLLQLFRTGPTLDEQAAAHTIPPH